MTRIVHYIDPREAYRLAFLPPAPSCSAIGSWYLPDPPYNSRKLEQLCPLIVTKASQNSTPNNAIISY